MWNDLEGNGRGFVIESILAIPDGNEESREIFK